MRTEEQKIKLREMFEAMSDQYLNIYAEFIGNVYFPEEYTREELIDKLMEDK